MPLRVLVIIPDPDRPEAELLCQLAERGHTVVCICSPGARARLKLEEAGIAIVEIDFKNRFDLKAMVALRRFIKVVKPDLVHVFSARALSVSLLAFIGFRVPIIAYRGTIGRLSRLDPLSWLSYLNFKVTSIIAVSEAVRQFLISIGRTAPSVITIHKGHRPEWYPPMDVMKRSEIQATAQDLLITCVANVRPVKGVDLLVDAFEMLDNPKAKLLLVGSLKGSDLEDRVLRSPKSDRIILAGFRPDATQLIGVSDIVVVPSREREGLPKALLEAMFQGVPVIGTAVGGIPEVIRDGYAGLLVEPNNAQAIATALKKLCDDTQLRQKLGSQAKEVASQHFLHATTVDKTEQLYFELATKHKGAVVVSAGS